MAVEFNIGEDLIPTLATTTNRERLRRPPGGAGPVSSAGQFVLGVGGGSEFDGHWHPYDEIWLVRDGCGEVGLDGTIHAVAAGDVIHIPSGVFHDIISVRPSLAVFWVSLAPEGTPEVHLDASGASPAPKHPVIVQE